VKRHKPAKKVVAVKVKKEGAPVVKKEEKREEKVDVGGPFPTFARPFEEECRNVTDGNVVPSPAYVPSSTDTQPNSDSHTTRARIR